MVWFQALLIVGLALVHVFAGRLRFLDVMPRSGWLSFAGGVSVAYVFIHVFPELEEAQRALGEHVVGDAEGAHQRPIRLISVSSMVSTVDITRAAAS